MKYFLPVSGQLAIILLLFLFPIGAIVFADEDPRYEAADRRALMAPASVTKSVKTLSSYLTQPFCSDEEKVRAIFRWVTQNISYDVEGFFSGRPSASQSEEVLHSRSSVCEGYSTLFTAIGKAAGLKVETIDGYAKGYGYQPGDKIPNESNHAWNAVKIRGEWKLVDCTWGAGKMDVSHAYLKEFEPYYFFTKPEEFIYRHLPADKRWQLLPKPISQAEFMNLPFAEPKYFQLGLNAALPQQVVLDLDAVNSLHFSTDQNVFCNADLTKKENKWESAVLVEKNGTQFTIHILPPAPGDFILNIYARKGNNAGKFPLAVSYKVTTRASLVSNTSFPTTYSVFAEKNVQLHAPLLKALASGTTQVFSLTVPGAEKVSVVCGEEWDFLKKGGDRFEGYIEIGAGTIGVYAQYSGDEKFQQLLEYEGTGTTVRAPGPVKFQQFINTEAELLAPMKKILPVGSEQLFRVKMPGARKACVLQGKNIRSLEKNGEYFEGTITITAGKNVVMGIYSSEARYEGLLEYEGK